MSFCIDQTLQAGAAAHGLQEARPGPRRRVLFVTPYLPSPPRFGGQRRLHGLISGLARTQDVSVLSLMDTVGDEARDVRDTQEYCQRVVGVPDAGRGASGARRRVSQLRSLTSSRSHDWAVHGGLPMLARLDAWLAEERFDVVQFEFAQMALRWADRPRAPGPILCVDEHNIEYDVLRRTSIAGVGRARRAYCALEARKLHLDEQRVWGALDGCVLTSTRDEDMLLGDSPRARTAVVPNGVDLDAFCPRPREGGPPTVLFFGAIDYFPNTDAVLFFLQEIWPSLKARCPTLRLRVVGRRPPARVLACRAPDIEITGVVDDVRLHLAQATVVVAPLRIGGGTRLKVLEAMAMGKAVVSTTLGVEGLDVVSGRDLLVADQPLDFATQVIRLVEDHAMADRLGGAARRLVQARYGWDASVARLSRFHSELLAARVA